MSSKFLAKALDYIYPPSCHHCKDITQHGRYLCDACFDNAKRLSSPFCAICSEAFEGRLENDFQCPNCRDQHFDFDFARAALKNTSSNHQLIIDYKYHKQFHLAGELAIICAETLKADERFSKLRHPVLVPVPLHWYRKLRRGFNQAEELATSISKLTELPIHKGLRRVRYTKTQTRLDRKARQHNLDNAFTASHLPTKYRSIILIDDVFTTGSTASACAATLRKQSPHIENIVVLTALRG